MKILIRLWLVLLCAALAPQFMMAQTVVIDIETEDEQPARTIGPNRAFYFYSMYEAGALVGASETGAAIENEYSPFIGIGGIFKLRVTNFLALGSTIGLRHTLMRIEQLPEKQLGDTILHTREKLRLTDLFGDLFVRINFGQHGDNLGKYLDLGIGGFWNVGRTYVFKDIDKSTGKQKLVTNYLPELKRLGAYAMVRIGLENISIFGRYRLGNLFKENYGLPEITPHTIGVQIGF